MTLLNKKKVNESAFRVRSGCTWHFQEWSESACHDSSASGYLAFPHLCTSQVSTVREVCGNMCQYFCSDVRFDGKYTSVLNQSAIRFENVLLFLQIFHNGSWQLGLCKCMQFRIGIEWSSVLPRYSWIWDICLLYLFLFSEYSIMAECMRLYRAWIPRKMAHVFTTSCFVYPLWASVVV